MAHRLGRRERRPIAEAIGLHFFGFTCLWLSLHLVTSWPDHRLGRLSLIVAVSGIGFAARSWAALGVRVLAIGNALLTTGLPGFLLLTGW